MLYDAGIDYLILGTVLVGDFDLAADIISEYPDKVISGPAIVPSLEISVSNIEETGSGASFFSISSTETEVLSCQPLTATSPIPVAIETLFL